MNRFNRGDKNKKSESKSSTKEAPQRHFNLLHKNLKSDSASGSNTTGKSGEQETFVPPVKPSRGMRGNLFAKAMAGDSSSGPSRSPTSSQGKSSTNQETGFNESQPEDAAGVGDSGATQNIVKQ